MAVRRRDYDDDDDDARVGMCVYVRIFYDLDIVPPPSLDTVRKRAL